SITGILTVVGRTPVNWMSKRQGAVETSTYGAEFLAMRTAVEEAISIRYMLRALGVPITRSTNLYGDNLGVIQNASNPDSSLKKKHTAISYHRVRECVAARIVDPFKILSGENYADMLTKALNSPLYKFHVNAIFDEPGHQ
ncbi:MAG: Ty1/Copia family ribonuclease HI, partial [Gaiellaceae bacterium]